MASRSVAMCGCAKQSGRNETASNCGIASVIPIDSYLIILVVDKNVSGSFISGQ
jgi:hypothetical protein